MALVANRATDRILVLQVSGLEAKLRDRIQEVQVDRRASRAQSFRGQAVGGNRAGLGNVANGRRSNSSIDVERRQVQIAAVIDSHVLKFAAVQRREAKFARRAV